jgi:hypothetical protein
MKSSHEPCLSEPAGRGEAQGHRFLRWYYARACIQEVLGSILVHHTVYKSLQENIGTVSQLANTVSFQILPNRDYWVVFGLCPSSGIL